MLIFKLVGRSGFNEGKLRRRVFRLARGRELASVKLTFLSRIALLHNPPYAELGGL